MTHKLLIVDDELPNLRLLQRLFASDYQCLTASSGAEAIRLLELHDIAILVTDQRMPGMTGIELLKRTERLRPHMVRILLTGYTDVEALVEAINSGLVYLYITKPWDNEDLKLRVNRACEHYLNNKARQSLAAANERLLQRLGEVKAKVIVGLSEMLRNRDRSRYDHTLRVCKYATLLADNLGLSTEAKDDLSQAALLHGLNRHAALHRAPAAGVAGSGTLAADEQSKSEAKLLHAIPELATVAELVDDYQENFDGSGRPRGLSKEQIPLASRILRVADEYDQMILPEGSAAMLHEEAMRFLSQRAGKQFDPFVIGILAGLSPSELSGPSFKIETHGELNRPHDSYSPPSVDAMS
ncbi:MAG: hypothetical protein QOD33_1738 [Pyrinomonadaceae bacterium]|nr:hypothetical protein [Pyrinomonadaceae bacterium]